MYVDDVATKESVKSELRRLHAAFPDITADYIILLTERVISNKFTLRRLRDAVNNVIDNFQYKVPNISDIIKFDKKVKLLTYDEMLKLNDQTGKAFQEYSKVIISGKNLYVKNSEKSFYNIPDAI
jgi:hypothetical protein